MTIPATRSRESRLDAAAMDAEPAEAERIDAADAELLARAREGDREAYAELWRRHQGAGLRMARAFTSLEAQDLVAQAYTVTLEALQHGRGPSGAFRPYLYAVIRNLANRAHHGRRELPVEDIVAVADRAEPQSAPAPGGSPDHTLIAKAFATLPERWQTVLWYTEVEGLPPRKVAPLLGIGENAVSALAHRAREGLRDAWIQAHVAAVQREGECEWAATRLGAHLGHGLGRRDAVRMERHLDGCPDCAALGAEAGQTSSVLAQSLLPLLVGGTAGAVWLAGGAGAGQAAAASTAASGALGGAASGAGAAGGAAAIAGAGGGASAMLAAAAVTAAIAGAGVAVALPVTLLQEPAPITVAPDPAPLDPAGGSAPDPIGALLDLAVTGAGELVGGVVGGVDEVLDGTLGGVGTVLEGVGGGVGAIVDGVLDGDPIGGVQNGVGSVLNGVGGGLQQVLDGVGEAGKSILGGLGGLGRR